MAIVINGSGTVTGLAVGGLPDATVDAGTLASGINKTSITDGGNATAVTINSTENIGIGVVPETWSIASALQIGADTCLYNDSGYSILSNNAYFNSGNKYINSGTANRFVLNDDGSMDFETAPSGSADAAITFTERVRIHTNGVTSIPAGVALGVGTANTASNVLDDYEEGTWTPALTGGGLSVSEATYTKVGNRVFLNMDVSPSSVASGNITISGVPFSPVGTSISAVGGDKFNWGTEPFGLHAYLDSGSEIYFFIFTANANATRLTNANISTATTIRCTFQYKV